MVEAVIKIAQEYKTNSVTVSNWLKNNGIKIRNHQESQIL